MLAAANSCQLDTVRRRLVRRSFTSALSCRERHKLKRTASHCGGRMRVEIHAKRVLCEWYRCVRVKLYPHSTQVSEFGRYLRAQAARLSCERPSKSDYFIEQKAQRSPYPSIVAQAHEYTPSGMWVLLPVSLYPAAPQNTGSSRRR